MNSPEDFTDEKRISLWMKNSFLRMVSLRDDMNEIVPKIFHHKDWKT